VSIFLDNTDAETSDLLTDPVVNSGSYLWKVGPVSGSLVASNAYILQIQSADTSTISSEKFFIASNSSLVHGSPSEGNNIDPVVVTVVTWVCLTIAIVSIVSLGYYGYRVLIRRKHCPRLDPNVMVSNRISNLEALERTEMGSDRADAEFVRTIRQFPFWRPQGRV
jgi:hypothetical protein